MQSTIQKQHLHVVNVVPVSLDDDALSPYGIGIVYACLRSNRDGVFFAGPRTGGSAWNPTEQLVTRLQSKLNNIRTPTGSFGTTLLCSWIMCLRLMPLH